MSAPRVVRAGELVAQLRLAGLPAVDDPAKVHGHSTPVVLIVPPRLRFDLPVGASATWQLFVVDCTTTAGLAAWSRLDDLVDQLAAVLPLTSADPASYAPTPGADPSPAYLVTFEEAVD